ncbi:MAG: AAA family ATPase [Acidobacteriota bacterium]|jgi:hypothetical protein|nr:AAA family ATPase [Acidobacteriota bacterium]
MEQRKLTKADIDKVRNTEGFPVDDIYRDLDTLQRFAGVIGADDKLIQDLRKTKVALLASETQTQPDPDVETPSAPPERKNDAAEFEPGQIVFAKSNPSSRGAVVAVLAGKPENRFDDMSENQRPFSWNDDPDAQRALSALRNGNERFVIITGAGGSGKTTLLQEWRKEAHPVVLAPTGIAALNAGGQTIHSFFNFSPQLQEMEKIRKMHPSDSLANLKTLVIDEVSMVRADLMEAIELRLRCCGPQKGTPWGGVRIILVGDMYQLPPVVSSGDEYHYFYGGFLSVKKGYSSPWWWAGEAVRETPWKLFELNKNYRTGDEHDFAAFLLKLRRGEISNEDIEKLNTRTKEGRSVSENVIRLMTTNDNVDAYNEERLRKIPTEQREFDAIITGDVRDDDDHWIAPKKLKLKNKARVLFVNNDRGGRWMNGDTGTVFGIGESCIAVERDRESQCVNVERAGWEVKEFHYDKVKQTWDEKNIASYKQFPLALGWARTIHKAQGQTYDSAHVDLGTGAFAHGQVYVALSRLRSFNGLTLERNLEHSEIICDEIVQKWLDYFKRRGDGEEVSPPDELTYSQLKEIQTVECLKRLGFTYRQKYNKQRKKMETITHQRFGYAPYPYSYGRLFALLQESGKEAGAFIIKTNNGKFKGLIVHNDLKKIFSAICKPNASSEEGEGCKRSCDQNFPEGWQIIDQFNHRSQTRGQGDENIAFWNEDVLDSLLSKVEERKERIFLPVAQTAPSSQNDMSLGVDNPPKCPKCGGPMVVRQRRSDGKPFYGCSFFPSCNGIVNI